MLKPLTQHLRQLSQSDARALSSTGIRLARSSCARSPRRAQRIVRAQSQEFLVLAKGSACWLAACPATTSRDRMTERNESVSIALDSIRNPNRKDRRSAPAAPLLKGSNTSRIDPFADGMRRQSAAADEQVMDRGAEGAAGGNDAI